jgi:hypothetical protein
MPEQAAGFDLIALDQDEVGLELLTCPQRTNRRPF